MGRVVTLGEDVAVLAILDVQPDGNVSWNTAGLDAARVYVLPQSGPPKQLVFEGPSGTEFVDWMRGQAYTWSLYGLKNGAESPQPLYTALITAPSPPVRASRTLPAPLPVSLAPWWPGAAPPGGGTLPPAPPAAGLLDTLTNALKDLPGGPVVWAGGLALVLLMKRKG